MLDMASSILASVSDLLMPMWMEICFVLFFPVGWVIVSKLASLLGIHGHAAKPLPKPSNTPSAFQAQADKANLTIKEDVAAGHLEDAAKTWRQVQANAPTNAETLRLVVRALAKTSPDTMVKEISHHLDRHAVAIRDTRSAAAILDALATVGNPTLMEEMHTELHGRLGIYQTSQTYEARLAGHAAAGDKERVDALVAEMQGTHQKLTARAHALVVKGYMGNGMLDAGLAQARAMLKAGFYVPSFAITQLIKAASDADKAEEIFDTLLARMELPHESVVSILEDCARRKHFALAQKVEEHMRASSSKRFPPAAYAALLKVLVVAADPRAQEIFKEMRDMGVPLTEGFYTAVLARCVDSKFLRFAQVLADACRAQDGMTLPVFGVLARVYAACGLHSQACDLFTELRAKDLQPDAAMCSAFMKLAVKAGRTEITQALFDLHPQTVDVQKYMLLIQSAGRDKDVDRAFAVFHKLEGAGLKLDSAVYNCVLDVCVCANDHERAHQWMQEMREKGKLDIVGYNTMIKGCVAKGDVKGAQELFARLSRDGLTPSDVTYNCLIYTATSTGSFQLAWEMVDTMAKAGTDMDQYTVGIIMRALKTQYGKPRDVKRAMALLDTVKFDLCMDGVVLSLAIETAIKYSELARVQFLVSLWEKSPLKPCAHTCAALVKAYAALHRLDRCRELWQQALLERGMEQNDVVLGCVLEAHVSAHQVDLALSIFNEVKTRVAPNMVLYSTLAKGFAAEGRVKEAMAFWHEIRASGAKMNTVCYNVLIDAQARQGAMEEVMTLFKAMEEDSIDMDVITFCTVLKGYCVTGDLESAIKMFKDMQQRGLRIDCVVYNTLLDGCIQHGSMDLADSILAEMEKSQVRPSSFTMGIVVKLYGRRHQVQRAFDAIEDMKAKHGLVPNVQVYTCLMSACIASRDVDRAAEVFKTIQATAGADARAFAVLICGYLRVSRLSDAVALVEEAYGLTSGKPALAPKQYIAADCLQRLFQSIKQQGKDQVGVVLLEKLRAAGVPLHLPTLAAALEGPSPIPRGASGHRQHGAGRW